jgi:hypothetical protein
MELARLAAIQLYAEWVIDDFGSAWYGYNVPAVSKAGHSLT